MDQTRICPDWIDTYLSFSEYNTEPPRLYRAWTAISVISAALRRKVYLPWHSELYPNMYICLVGPPGCRKGTAMGPGYKMLIDKGIRMAAEATTREALIRYLKESGDIDVDDNGVTYVHASLTVFSQELTVFLGYNNQTLMSDLTDWFDCREQWSYRTKNMGVDEIQGVYLNLIGATTPELIHSALPVDAVGSGLTSRMIFVYEEAKGPRCSTPFMYDHHHQLRANLMSDLGQIMMLRGSFVFDQYFLKRWDEWYMCEDCNIPFDDQRFAGYFERRPLHMLKLSMIMSASRSNEMVITIADFERALNLLKQTEVKMPMTFIGHGKNPTANVTTEIMSYCGLKGITTESELMKRFYRDISKRGLEESISTMQKMGIVNIYHRDGNAEIHYIKRRHRNEPNQSEPGDLPTSPE